MQRRPYESEIITAPLKLKSRFGGWSSYRLTGNGGSCRVSGSRSRPLGLGLGGGERSGSQDWRWRACARRTASSTKRWAITYSLTFSD
jgi:hypothetical protein